MSKEGVKNPLEGLSLEELTSQLHAENTIQFAKIGVYLSPRPEAPIAVGQRRELKHPVRLQPEKVPV